MTHFQRLTERIRQLQYRQRPTNATLEVLTGARPMEELAGRVPSAPVQERPVETAPVVPAPLERADPPPTAARTEGEDRAAGPGGSVARYTIYLGQEDIDNLAILSRYRPYKGDPPNRSELVRIAIRVLRALIETEREYGFLLMPDHETTRPTTTGERRAGHPE